MNLGSGGTPQLTPDKERLQQHQQALADLLERTLRACFHGNIHEFVQTLHYDMVNAAKASELRAWANGKLSIMGVPTYH